MNTNISVLKFNEFISERKKLVFNFYQLIVGMKFETEQYEIVSINYDTQTFDYINNSNITVTSSVLYIPENITYNDKQFVFRKLNDDSIFNIYNLTNFEESLYDKLHIKSLRKIIEIQKIQFNNLKNDFDSKVYHNNPTKLLLDYEEKFRFILNNYSIPHDEFLLNFKEKLQVAENKRKLSDTINVLKNQVKKYRNLYFDVLKNTQK